MKLDVRSLRDHLERMGQEEAAPPSPGFARRVEERLRAERRITVVEPAPAPPVFRPRVRLTWALAVAAAAAVLLQSVPDEGARVSVSTSGASSTTAPTTAPALPDTTSTTAAATTTTTAAPPPPAAVTTVPAARPTTTTTVARPTTTTTVPTVLLPPETPTTTTTTKPVVLRVDLRCEAGSEAGTPFVACTWGGLDDASLAGWRMYRAVGDAAKQEVWFSADPAARTFADRDVRPGVVYHYLVEAVSGAGRTLAKGGIVDVACCPG